MITSITNYTDSHGITHAAPIFALKSIYNNESTNETLRFSASDGQYSSSISENININYSVQYWPSQAAFDAGNRALEYFDANGESSFYFNPETQPVDVVAEAEEHFLTKVMS